MLNKIFLVTKREYMTRVRKKSFIIMTIVAPLLMVAFYSIVIYFAFNRDIGANVKDIYVSDPSGMYTGKLSNNEHINFIFGSVKPGTEAQFIRESEYYGLLVVNGSADSLQKVKMFSREQADLSTVMYIEKQLENEVKSSRLRQNGIDGATLKRINETDISISTIKVTDKGAQTGNVAASTFAGYSGAILIYLFIFLYGVQIMRGVIEEKSNRIVEVIISSVKPFELMMGKIIGIALVGLTQFIIWVGLIGVTGGGVSGMLMQRQMANIQTNPAATEQVQKAADSGAMAEIIQAVTELNYPYLIGLFLFYFIGGYLFYGALFAAIGSAVDNETDTQQFMLPVTMPLIFALIIAQSAVIANPNGVLAFWLSVIPFTSPVVMMVRLPFDVPLWQVLLSMTTLTLGFIFTTYIAGRVYRIGILMYGKKPSYKLIVKWLFSKE